MKPIGRPDSFASKIQRHRGVLALVAVPVVLVTLVILFMPRSSDSVIENVSSRKVWPILKSPKNYAVVFDAGSSGSRVHVYCFNQYLDLVPIGNELELFMQIKPGLSAYANDPREAANSLVSLLDKAHGAVPRDLRSKAPVRVGATAGLRDLGTGTSEKILQAVRELLKSRSTFKYEPTGVSVLNGTQEGSYQWVTINYLLRTLGKKYSNTVGVVDLGGGSVQMAYAISEKEAAKAPQVGNGVNAYVREMHLKGRKYYLYVHSYLHFGLLAARAEILKVSGGSGNPCILAGYDGSYNYGGKTYRVTGSPFGASLDECRRVAINTLKAKGSKCKHTKCTFGGAWNGGGGDGQKNLYVASFFFDRAAEVGLIDPNLPVAKVRPVDFEKTAKRVCKTKLQDSKAKFPQVQEGNLPYLCMDLVYQYTLLVDGFGLGHSQMITLVKQVKYKNFLVEAAWPLGSAIEGISSMS